MSYLQTFALKAIEQGNVYSYKIGALIKLQFAFRELEFLPKADRFKAGSVRGKVSAILRCIKTVSYGFSFSIYIPPCSYIQDTLLIKPQ